MPKYAPREICEMVADFAAWTDAERYVRERIMFAARGDDASDVYIEYEEPGVDYEEHGKWRGSVEFEMDREDIIDPRDFRKIICLSFRPTNTPSLVDAFSNDNWTKLPYCLEALNDYVNKAAAHIEQIAETKFPDKQVFIDPVLDRITVPDLRGEMVDMLISAHTC
jgi:hypothetical protein